MRAKVLAAAIACTTWLGGSAAHATEGAGSYFVPGGFGSFLVAVPPAPGFTVASQTYLFSGQAQRAVLGDRATFGLTASALYEYVVGTYVWSEPVLGGRLQVGAAIPAIGAVGSTATLDVGQFGSFSRGASSTGFGDLELIPFALYWNFGELNVKLAQYIIAPTGRYDRNSLANVGRNYWAFDTQIGITWFNKPSGTELSVLPGVMINTTNPATDYRSGHEFHLDFMANQFIGPTFAIGLQGYWYKQINGDSGSGAVLGPFMGEAVGLGPAVLWAPEAMGGRASIILKWIHDIGNTNRLNGDWGQILFSYRF